MGHSGGIPCHCAQKQVVDDVTARVPGFALVELGNLNIWILRNTKLSELDLAFEITVSK